jgi:beta-glucanase (GH16 family)
VSLLLLLSPPAVAPPPTGAVTLTYVGAGTAPSGTGLPATGNVTATPNLPATMGDGNLVLVAVGSKPDTAGLTVSDPAWTFVGNGAGGTGVQGAGTGAVRESWYSRVKDASWSAMPDFTLDGTGNCLWCHAYVISADVAATYDVAMTSGQRTVESTAWAVTCDTNPGLTTGDMVLFGSALALGSLTTTSETITAPGATFATATEIGEPKTTRNNDVGGFTAQTTVTAGTATGAPTVTATMSAAVGATGVSTVVRVRGVAVVTGPTTTVGSSQGTSWTTTAPVTSTRATTWQTRTPVTTTRASTWQTRATTTGTRTTTWAARATVTATQSASWATTGTATATQATTWDTLTPTNSTRDTAWAVADATAALTTVTSTRGATWTTRATIPATHATTWATRTTTATTHATTWAARVSVATTRSSTWKTSARVTGTHTTTWATTAVTAATRASSWTTSQPVTDTRASTWNVAGTLATVTANRGTTWAVAGTITTVTTTRSTTWAARAPVSAAHATTWAALARTTGTRATTWATAQPVTTTRATTWTVLATAPGELLFADDFTGPTGTAPSTAYWTAATGAGGWGNAELQYYTATGNAALDGAGNLAITARQETVAGAPYTSARIHGNGKVTTTYGRIEARIRVPKGQGLWPAFWMMADEGVYGSWPRNGEIDIMEIVNQAVASFHSLHGPTTADPSVAWHLSRTWTSGADLSAGFHVYAVEWDPDRLTFYVDTTLVRTFTTGDMPAGSTWPFNGRPFYPILNLAVGGGATGAVPDPAVFPATMLVDYVRIYAQAPYTQINPKVETLVTGFTDQREFDNWGPNVVLVNGQAQMTPTAAYSSLVSQRRFDLTNSAVSVRLVQPPNVGAGTTQAVMQLTASTGNRLELGWGNNTLYFQEIVGGVTDATYLGYSATAHRYLRVAHDGTNVVWSTSPDGTTWTTRRTKVSTLPLTGVGVNLVAGYYGAETTPGTVLWDELNATVPVTTVTSTRGTTWTTRAPVTTARATTWTLRTLLATTRPATWDTLTRLTAQHAASWLVGTTVTSTRGTTWAQLEVEGPIGRITSVRWRVLAASGDLSTPGAVGHLQILEAIGATR